MWCTVALGRTRAGSGTVRFTQHLLSASARNPAAGTRSAALCLSESWCLVNQGPSCGPAFGIRQKRITECSKAFSLINQKGLHSGAFSIDSHFDPSARQPYSRRRRRLSRTRQIYPVQTQLVLLSTSKPDTGDGEVDESRSSEMSESETSPEETKPPSTDTTTPQPSTRLRGFALETEIDRELYRQVSREQSRQREKYRLRTAVYVWRSLCGNGLICIAKFAAWVSSGSSAMLAELIHSIVDCLNQSLMLVGLRDSRMVADKKHPYGYGKSMYFWALVSALGTFFLGAGISMTNAVNQLMHPHLHDITSYVWAILGISFVVDGFVLYTCLSDIVAIKPKGVSFWKHLSGIRDPAALVIVLEDGAACLGVVVAVCGIGFSHLTGDPIYDGMAGIGISALLGIMGLVLARMNYHFLLGKAVDKEITDDIEKILKSRRSIEGVRSVQSQWIGPETFSYKAEVDFDGTYLAAKLMEIYQGKFMGINDRQTVQLYLSVYAEDVIRTVEREVRYVEAQIRKRYPGAVYIELEPMSSDANRLAIDDALVEEKRRTEFTELGRILKSLNTEAAEQRQKKQEMEEEQAGTLRRRRKKMDESKGVESK